MSENPFSALDSLTNVTQSSKKLSIKIKLTRPILGTRTARSGLRLLDVDRDKNDNSYVWFYPDQDMWRWAFTEALDSLGLLPDVGADYIRFPLKIKTPPPGKYIRVRDSRNPKSNPVFECFSAGTVLSFDVFILGKSSHNQDSPLRPPTEEEVIECFKTIGEFIGISPWGSKFGYGRFDVV